MYMKKRLKKFIKNLILLEHSKILQEFYTLLNFNFIMINIVHKILILLQNHLTYHKDNSFKRFFQEYNKFLLFLKK